MVDKVIYSGVVLSDYFTTIVDETPPAGRKNETREISGMHGVRVTGSVLEPLQVGIYVILNGRSKAERREDLRTLMGVVYSDELKPLYISSDDGLYRMAILDGDKPFDEHVGGGRVRLNFLAESPILYGEKHSVRVPSGGSVGIYVNGTYKTYPNIVANAAYGAASTFLWGLRLDEGDYIRMVTGSRTLAKKVELDCESRVGKLANVVKLPTMDSDWLELSPGAHTLRNDVGVGACTVTWQDRWL
jgi:predicted phage tail component-like protein